MSTVPDALRAAAETFEERNREYGENYMLIGNAMKALFPNGVHLQTADEFLRWHIFELIVIKLSRLATTRLSHEDSARDITVYGAMLEKLIKESKWNVAQF